jgi:hypothetical protein
MQRQPGVLLLVAEAGAAVLPCCRTYAAGTWSRGIERQCPVGTSLMSPWQPPRDAALALPGPSSPTTFAFSPVSLFLRWYEVRHGGPAYTAWEAFSKADILLAIAAGAGALSIVPALATGQRWPYLGGAIAGSLAAALIVYLASRPPGSGVAPGAIIDYGVFVGFAGAIVLVAGALWSGLAVAPEASSPSRPPTA